MPNPKYVRALSVAIPRWVDEFRDNIVNVAPFLRAMTQLGAVNHEPGGSEIVLPIRYQSASIAVVSNPAAASYDSMAEDNTVTAAGYQWAEVYGAIFLADRELNMLRNDASRMGRYVQAVTKGAMEDFGRFVNTQMMGNLDAGDISKIGGLPYYISDYTLAVGSYGANTAKPLGGITNSDSAHYWNSVVVNNVGAISFSVLDLHLANLFANTGETPALAVMPSNLYSKLRSSAQTVQALNQQGGKATIGFNSIAYGDTLIIPDNACPSGNVFLINTNAIQLFFDQNRVSTEQVPVRQPGQFWKLIWHVQLVCSGRRYNAKLLGVTV